MYSDIIDGFNTITGGGAPWGPPPQYHNNLDNVHISPTNIYNNQNIIQIVHKVTEEDQDELLVNIQAQGFVGLVYYTRQVSLPQATSV